MKCTDLRGEGKSFFVFAYVTSHIHALMSPQCIYAGIHSHVTNSHRGITLVIFVLPVDLVQGDGGADWVTEQQATGEQRTDRVEKRKSRVRDRNV